MMPLSRRQAIAGMGCAGIVMGGRLSRGADLTRNGTGDTEAAVMALEERAAVANILPSPTEAAGATKSGEAPSFRNWKARLLNIITKADESGTAPVIASDADVLLHFLTMRERSPREAPPITDLEEKAALIPDFNVVKQEYRMLFDSCKIRDNRLADVDLDQRILLLAPSVQRYKSLSSKTAVPWYFIGIVHDLEASFRFRGHLHNGDPLSNRTVTEPKGRPPIWLPPSDWESSGKDALEYEQSVKKHLWGKPDDWSLERILYRFEMYNGFGTRSHGIPTPYLWSFSTHYLKGKYTSDGHWDANAISDQCGAAVLLCRLIQTGVIEPPPHSG